MKFVQRNIIKEMFSPKQNKEYD